MEGPISPYANKGYAVNPLLKVIAAVGLAAFTLGAPGHAVAQGYPVKPVRMIAPLPPGGGGATSVWVTDMIQGAPLA